MCGYGSIQKSTDPQHWYQSLYEERVLSILISILIILIFSIKMLFLAEN